MAPLRIAELVVGQRVGVVTLDATPMEVCEVVATGHGGVRIRWANGQTDFIHGSDRWVTFVAVSESEEDS